MYTCVPNSPYSDLDAGPSDPHPEPEPYDYHMLDTPILFMFRGALSTCIENMCPSFFGFFFTADCDTKLPVCLRSARCVSEPTFLDFFDHYEQDSAHISSTTRFSSGWLTEWKRDVVSEVLNYSFSSLATQNSFIGIFFFPQLGQKKPEYFLLVNSVDVALDTRAHFLTLLTLYSGWISELDEVMLLWAESLESCSISSRRGDSGTPPATRGPPTHWERERRGERNKELWGYFEYLHERKRENDMHTSRYL